MQKNIAIIGSGPASLFEALYQSKIGNRVKIFESSNTIGGAWGSLNFSDKYKLEIGCHIWDVDESVYSFIEKIIGEELITLKPSPVLIYKNKKVPYDWKHNSFVLKALKSDFIGFLSGKKYIKPRIKPRKYKYPMYGSKILIEILLKKLYKEGVSIQTDCEINSILFEGEKPLLILPDNINAEYDHVYLTSFSGVDYIGDIELILNKRCHSHFHLILNGNSMNKSISYARLMNHQFIHRVSDTTIFSKSELPIITVGVFKDKLPELPEIEILELIRIELVRLGWLNPDSNVEEYFYNDYYTELIDNSQISEIRKCGNITILRSINFIYSIKENLDKWKLLIED